MQRCLLDFNSKQTLNQMRVRIATAAPTPSTALQRNRLILSFKTRDPEQATVSLASSILPVKGKVVHLDGFYGINNAATEYNCRNDLLQYLQFTKDQYNLDCVEALHVLQLFKNNFKDAWRHLYNDGSFAKMIIDYDTPWRMELKSISQLPGLEIFLTHIMFRNAYRIYFVGTKVMVNVLPKQPLVQRFAGRYMRVQRVFYHGRIIAVTCAMPVASAPVEVAALLLPSKPGERMPYRNMMIDFKHFLGPILLTCKDWKELDQAMLDNIIFDAPEFQDLWNNHC